MELTQQGPSASGSLPFSLALSTLSSLTLLSCRAKHPPLCQHGEVGWEQGSKLRAAVPSSICNSENLGWELDTQTLLHASTPGANGSLHMSDHS